MRVIQHIPKGAALQDYVTISVLADELSISYGSAYYRVLKERVQIFRIKGQRRPLFLRRKDANW